MTALLPPMAMLAQTRPLAPLDTLVSALAAPVRLLAAVAETNRRIAAWRRLEAQSDATLAQGGLVREDLPRRAFANLIG